VCNIQVSAEATQNAMKQPEALDSPRLLHMVLKSTPFTQNWTKIAMADDTKTPHEALRMATKRFW